MSQPVQAGVDLACGGAQSAGFPAIGAVRREQLGRADGGFAPVTYHPFVLASSPPNRTSLAAAINTIITPRGECLSIYNYYIL